MRKNWFIRSLSMLLTVLILASGVIVFTNNNQVFADPTDGWVQSNGKWYYYCWGTLQTDGWVYIQDSYGRVWYRFDSDGVMVESDKAFTGWHYLDDGWYYYEAPGVRAEGWRKIDGEWYYFSVYDGWAYCDGTAYIDDDMYYFDENCVMQTGWVYDEYSGVTFYMDETGRSVLGHQVIDGEEYEFGTVYSAPGYENWAGEGLLCGWVLVAEDEWHCYDENCKEIKSGFGQTYDGVFYYLDENGKISINPGWRLIEGEWYFFNEDGAAYAGWIRDGGKWYYLKPEDAAMAKGWVTENGSWYYMDDSGVMKTGWVRINDKWFYFGPSGDMKTGWVYDFGKWYFMNPDSGEMATGWIYSNNNWYYLMPSGDMRTGWLNDNGTWYYLDNSGAMKTGWQFVGGHWYFFYSSGAMAADTWVGNYYVDASGAWTKSK